MHGFRLFTEGHLRKMYYFAFTICLAIITSCASTFGSSGNVANIDVKNIQTGKDFFDSVRIVKLQTNDSCLVSKVNGVRVNSKCIVINSDNKLYLFNQTGRFISCINHFGKGHQEYAAINDFRIFQDKVYILSRDERKLMVYDMHDKFLSEHHFADAFNSFSIIDPSHIILASDNCNDTKKNFVCYDLATRKVAWSTDDFEKNEALYFVNRNTFINMNNPWVVTHPFDDAIYQVTPKGLHKICSFLFNTEVQLPSDYKSMPFIDLNEKMMNKAVVTHINAYDSVGSNKYIVYPMFGTIGGYSTYISKIDAAGNSSTLGFSTVADKDFEYLPVGNFQGIYNDEVIMLCHASDLLEYQKQNKLKVNEKLNIQQNDNPVLFFYRLRKS